MRMGEEERGRKREREKGREMNILAVNEQKEHHPSFTATHVQYCHYRE